MGYDNAGNLTYDSYSGEGPRNYDAENRVTQGWWGYGQWQTYTYDGNGKRTRRSVNGSETWQVYGIGGELLAEYSAHATPTSPQKEYGYRNGELLITAAGSSCGVGNTGPRTWLGTDGALGHLTGHAEGTNWAVYAGSDSPMAMGLWTIVTLTRSPKVDPPGIARSKARRAKSRLGFRIADCPSSAKGGSMIGQQLHPLALGAFCLKPSPAC